MSQLTQLLTEAASKQRVVQEEANRLASKWEKTRLLTGLNGAEKSNMAMMLENQAKQLVTEVSLSGGGTAGATFTAGVGEQWAGVALPLVRKIFGQISSKEFLSVQPMNLPSGLVFYLDFQYGGGKAGANIHQAGGDVYGSGSLYGLTEGGSAPSEGLYGAGRFSYSTNNTSSKFGIISTASADWSTFNYDANFSASAANYSVYTIDMTGANADLKGVRAFIATASGFDNTSLAAFTSVSGNTVSFVAADDLAASSSILDVTYQLQPTDNKRGDFEDGNTTLNGLNTTITIPEINVKMKSEPIVAKTKKLKAQWTPEFAQDIQAYQNIDAEVELTNVMSEYVSMEIDLELLDMLIQSVPTGNTEVWSAKNNEAISGLTTTNLGFLNTQGQWFQTIGTKMNKLSNRIHQLTLRGGANVLMTSPTVATVLESIPGFASNFTGDVTKNSYAFGVQKIGNFNNQYTVYKNPFFTDNLILMAYKGSQYIESGAVFSPYVPLIMTPLLLDPDTFTPRKGLMSRYGKKMIRPEFYGLIKVAGLDTL